MEKELRRIEEFRYQGKGNSLTLWAGIKSPLRVVFNFMIIYSSRFIPFLGLKSWLLKRTGMKIGKNVSIGLGAMFDIFWPELIEIGDNSIIGYNATVLCHEFLIDRWKTGKVKIGKNCVIGALSLVMPGVETGDGSTVAACSLANKNVSKGATVGGIPAKPIKT